MISSSSSSRCPEPTSRCDCSNVSYGYELLCPAFTVQVKPRDAVHVQCITNDANNFSVLDGMRIGAASTLNMRLCPLPTVPLSQVMQTMGLTKVTSVQIIYTGVLLDREDTTTVTRQLFDGLSNVTSLTMNTNGTTQLPFDVFADMPDLTLIDLKNNNVVLPKTIFRSVPNLEVLELGSNNMSYLEPGVFHNLDVYKRQILQSQVF